VHQVKDAPARLSRELVGDLDNIILMAMRKEPERRYPSVDQFSEDIRRHLENRPVRARQDTLGYRAGKFMRRHKAGVSFAAVLLVVLIGFAVTMAVQAARIARERDRANQVTEFLIDHFEIADPGEARGNTVTVREILDRGAERARQELKAQPEVRAALMNTMGRLYFKLGLFDSAAPLLEEAVAIRRESLVEHPDLASSLHNLAEVRHARGELDAAEQLYRQSLEMRRNLFGDEHTEVATSITNLAILFRDKADHQAAEPLLRQALDMRRKLLGQEHPEVAKSINELALLLKEKGDHAAAEPLYREALALRVRLFGEDHPEVAESLNNLAVLLNTREQFDESEQLGRRALDVSRRVYGEEHPYIATYMSNLAGTLKKKGDSEAAESLYRAALAMKRKLLGDEHPEVATLLNNLAALYRDRGDYDRAEPLFREAVSMKRKQLGDSHPSVATSVNNLGIILHAKGDHKAAEPFFKDAVEIFTKALGPDHWMVAETRSNYAACLAKLGRNREAEEHLIAAHAGLRTAFGDNNPRTQKTITRIVELYESWPRPDDASRYRALLLSKESKVAEK
jgi:serine/threonine-protein kinase